MASARKESKKSHNPVESVCRKIRAIRKREAILNPIRQIAKCKSSSPDSPQSKTKRAFGEMLGETTATHVPVLDSHFSGSERRHSLVSRPETMSSRTSPSSPQDSLDLVVLKSSESCPRQRPWSDQRPPSLESQSGWGCFPSKDLDGLKTESEGIQEDGAYSAHGEEFLAGVFHECNTKHTGTVGVNKIMTYLRQTTSQDSEDSVLEELGTMLDPENTNPCVDLDTFQGIVKEWIAHSMSRRDMSDLIACVADLLSNKQKLEEENRTCKLALEAMEEANRQLAEDCTSLHLQMKTAQQAVRRGSLLKEELEDLKVTMAVSEEQKTMAVAQNKQLETEIRTLILKIRALQEENTKNVMDINSLEKKIEEVSETKKECQMQQHMYEDMLLTKDASLQKKDLCIEELESTIMEYRSIIENLREDKNNLGQELQLLQHKVIVNGIQEHDKDMSSEGEKSLYHELTLAQAAETASYHPPVDHWIELKKN
ncbi:inositol 1,4,5-triphosphate receptor associated 2 [Onychomys torridus]|uniref:inositol 1,4,5-triphosphate receptor associated 2 n=1 Tax=Onychomys torridus TaxID=38674 RepID=UPI00167FAC33|nr:inositol 1,4,5-triphosphate receptor associated 2 [Onychomys torridus]